MITGMSTEKGKEQINRRKKANRDLDVPKIVSGNISHNKREAGI